MGEDAIGKPAATRDVIYNTGPCPAPGGKIIFTSNRNSFVPRKGNFNFEELIVSGGGAKNPTLMHWLEHEARGLGLRLRSSDEFGIPSSAKEAVAFVIQFSTF